MKVCFIHLSIIPLYPTAAGTPKKGLDTCDVERFVRYWYEVGRAQIELSHSYDEPQSHSKWFPYAKDGDFRKWFGNNDRIVNWENDGEEIRNYKDEHERQKSRPQNTSDYFKPIVTWTAISSGAPSMRFNENGIYGGGGTAIVPSCDLYALLAFMNSSVSLTLLQFLSPTLNYEAGHMAKLPCSDVIIKDNMVISKLSQSCIVASKADWDTKIVGVRLNGFLMYPS